MTQLRNLPRKPRINTRLRLLRRGRRIDTNLERDCALSPAFAKASARQARIHAKDRLCHSYLFHLRQFASFAGKIRFLSSSRPLVSIRGYWGLTSRKIRRTIKMLTCIDHVSYERRLQIHPHPMQTKSTPQSAPARRSLSTRRSPAPTMNHADSAKVPPRQARIFFTSAVRA